MCFFGREIEYYISNSLEIVINISKLITIDQLLVPLVDLDNKPINYCLN